jgi:type II secretory pathway pseudopilin PulG
MKQGMMPCRCGRSGLTEKGFTLLELLVVVATIIIISSLAVPALSSYYSSCRVKVAMLEVAAMIREAKRLTQVDDRYHAVAFDVATGKVSLLSGRGGDGIWNSGDDEVVRSFTLASKGNDLKFGYGDHGPVPGLAAHPDGITFQTNHTLVCNPELTGNAGTVYIMSISGPAMALTMNSRDLTYTLRRWNGGGWERL